jgi:hypothetical protein
MLPVGLIGFMLPHMLEVGFYADPPKNKLGAPQFIQKICNNDLSSSTVIFS